MKKPDPTNSNIRDIFQLCYGSQNPSDSFELFKEKGTPLFNDDDPIVHSTHPLDQVLMDIVKKMNITDEYFTEKYKDYALRFKGYHIIQTSNNKSNLLKALKSGNITMKRFLEVNRVLDLTPVRYLFEFDYQGKKISFELNDTKGDSAND